MAGNSSFRGTRVGSGAKIEGDSVNLLDRQAVSYWDAEGNETVRYYSADLSEDEIPDVIDSPKTGLPAGRDPLNPPVVQRNEPYKTHLAYVKERRTPEEAEELLNEALRKLRERRGTLTQS